MKIFKTLFMVLLLLLITATHSSGKAEIYKSEKCAFTDANGDWYADSNAKWWYVISPDGEGKYHCVGQLPETAVYPETTMVTFENENCKILVNPKGRAIKFGICPS